MRTHVILQIVFLSFLYPVFSQNPTGSFTDSRDGKVYKTVKIGGQWWMAENLAYLPSVSPPSEGSTIEPIYYVYDYSGTDIIIAKSISNYANFGVLYNWPAAMNGASSSTENPSGVQGACPQGWHLPSDDEWKQLEMTLGLPQEEADETGYRGSDQGTQLKTTNGWSNNGSGTNVSGFSALPAGSSNTDNLHIFYGLGEKTLWWSTTQLSGYNYSYYRNVDASSTKIYRSTANDVTGFSVRCVSDITNYSPTGKAGPDQSIDEGTSVTLDGSASFDPDGDPLTYLWSAPVGIILSDATSVSPTFTALEVAKDTTLTFTLVVNDGTSDSAADTALITVKNKIPLPVQITDLTAGWNIVSFNLVPDSLDLKKIFEPLITDNALIKVQDELGNSLEDYGMFGGWTNNIGLMALTEGYKIKVNKNCQLSIEGIPAAFPFEIPLKEGWNIMGYPMSDTANAQSIVQQLIDRGTLIKVQDESGNAIEDMGVFGGWTNNLGKFKPGEGYKIKVTRDDTLNLVPDPNANWLPGNPWIDIRDGNDYKTVKIGDQVWMAENLAWLPAVSPPTAGSLTEPYYYVCDYSGTDVSAAMATANYLTYGVLYNWPAALTACPAGWHLPSDAEWKQLEMALGMTQIQADAFTFRGTDQGKQMKTTSGWNNNGNGTNSSGFSALPGGSRNGSGGFGYVGDSGNWWSSTETPFAWGRWLSFFSALVYRDYYGMDYGFSVRCVRDF